MLIKASDIYEIIFHFFFVAHDLFAEDEGSRIKGRRITLSDINGNALEWRPFNGTWISGKYCKTRFSHKFAQLRIQIKMIK